MTWLPVRFYRYSACLRTCSVRLPAGSFGLGWRAPVRMAQVAGSEVIRGGSFCGCLARATSGEAPGSHDTYWGYRPVAPFPIRHSPFPGSSGASERRAHY